MAGSKLVLALTFTNTTLLPKPPLDPMLSAGSLAFYEPSHPSSPWPAGVPANSALLPNIAHESAALLLAPAAEDRPLFRVIGTPNASSLRLERTTKGGLYGIQSQITAGVSNVGYLLQHPTAVWDYVEANLAHQYFVSLWRRVTRVHATSAAQSYSSMTYDNSGTKLLYLMMTTAGAPSVGVYRLGRRTGVGINTVGDSIYNVGALWNATAPSGTRPGVSGSWGGNAAVSWGPFSPNSSNAANSIYAPSFAFYRFYLEDLTVSGRTYAAVDAIDNAEFTKHVSTLGGRYYNDVLTDPATFP